MTDAPPVLVTTFDAAEVFARVRARLSPTLAANALDRAVTPISGDHLLNHWAVTAEFLETTRVAAVLVGLVEREEGVTVLLTRRTAGLRDHAGQVAFPGGKVDASDATPADTALREAAEEIGLPASAVEILGYLDPYLTRTGFRIIPVVARVEPPFSLALNADEVVEAFEMPFDHLMTAANHEMGQRTWQSRTWQFYSMTHGERTVWGITAGIIRILYERLYQ